MVNLLDLHVAMGRKLGHLIVLDDHTFFRKDIPSQIGTVLGIFGQMVTLNMCPVASSIDMMPSESIFSLINYF